MPLYLGVQMQNLKLINWRTPIILTKWTPSLSLTKDGVTNVPIWVKLHRVPVIEYSEDGLSLIATQVGKPIMLDAFTSSMCAESWGCISFACALIEVSSGFDLKSEVVMAIPNEEGNGHTQEVIIVEYEWKPPHCADCKTFGHSLDTCPKSVREPKPSAKTMEELCDGFTKVRRRKTKGRKSDQQPNSRHSVTLDEEDNRGVPKPVCAHETTHGVDRVSSGVKKKSPTGDGKKNLVFSPKSKIHYFDSDGTVFDDLDQEVETADYGNG
ncbi:reverse transcriptase domain-containing protein [Tanacetum coccineum]